MEKFERFQDLTGLLETFSKKETVTNNYLLLDSYQDLILKEQLFYLTTKSNLCFLVKKDGFFRLYYHINNTDEPVCFNIDKPITMEIIYRGEKNKPLPVIAYWESNGFKQHITRENLAASYSQIKLPEKVNPSVLIKFADNDEELRFSKEIFEKTFDRYTGDILTLDKTKQFALSKNLLVSYFEGRLSGALQFEIKNNVVWIGHIAVSAEFRGKGIANELVRSYIVTNANQPNTRFQLWVMQDNEGAIRLYKKFGFVYANKTSASMLKL